MKGNKRIAEIMTKDYGVKDLTPYEEINYEISNFTDEISRVKITSKTNRNFCAPVYAMFDGYHMAWYGDYGEYVFNCTWKTNVHNLAYCSPYYQLEKCQAQRRTEFDENECAEQFMKSIKNSFWYEELDQDQKARLEEFIQEPYDYICFDDVLYEYEEICEKLQTLYRATSDKYDWVAELRNTDFDDLQDVFDCEEYEMYSFGEKAPLRYFIILYMLSVVANLEAQRKENEVTENE